MKNDIQKKNINENKEIIDPHCYIIRTEDQLIIKVNWAIFSKIYFYLILLCTITAISIFILSFLNNILRGLIFLSIVAVVIIPFLVGYLYYKNRKTEWILNKVSNRISHYKVSSSQKMLNQLEFSEVEYLIYRRYRWSDSSLSDVYNLMFYLKNRKKSNIFSIREPQVLIKNSFSNIRFIS